MKIWPRKRERTPLHPVLVRRNLVGRRTFFGLVPSKKANERSRARSALAAFQEQQQQLALQWFVQDERYRKYASWHQRR